MAVEVCCRSSIPIAVCTISRTSKRPSSKFLTKAAGINDRAGSTGWSLYTASSAGSRDPCLCVAFRVIDR